MDNPQALFYAPETVLPPWCIVVLALLLLGLVVISIIRTERQVSPRHTHFRGARHPPCNVYTNARPQSRKKK